MEQKESIILLVFSGSRSIPGTNALEVLILFVCGTQVTLNLEHRATFCLFIGYSLFTGAYLTLDNVKLMAVCPIPRHATILPASY